MKSTNENPIIPLDRVDVSKLVGHNISVYPAQQPGLEFLVKVVATQENYIFVESGTSFSQLDNLVNQQQVVLQLSYRDQTISIEAKLRRSEAGRCSFLLEDKVSPLTRRKYFRVPLQQQVRMAPYSLGSYREKKLSALRWLETTSMNVSSGGVLVELPNYLEKEVQLLVNIELDSLFFPPLILGQVRHCFQNKQGRFHIGIEFLVKEKLEGKIPQTMTQKIPKSIFNYTNNHRDKLNRKLTLWNHDKESQFKDGSL